MKKIATLFILMLAFGCHKEVDRECIEQPHDGRACPFIYNPVCGCNGKTYANSCVAESVGIIKYTAGACKSKR
ncbi:Kazal-type serine protease inhibitor domain-containing protein [Salmonirosea aquatica]|uniref:Protease inhibitor Kazal-type n=1 Tax=Salmonirosea aquatica TaxID=2654236 RepID=A0A7C9F882_9BACT|nr:protease inhibitor Kazal-type [Cytophagaceae bacterium SJW1-29]